MKVLNHDIANLVRRIRRFKFEVHKSVSSNLSEFTSHDLSRLTSFLGSIKSFVSWMVSQPLLDLPETSPMETDIGEALELDPIENEDCEMIIKLLDLAEMELSHSQSSRRSSGLVSHDKVRLDAIVEKCERFLADHVSVSSPVDLPESQPNYAVSGLGRKSI